MSAVRLEAHLGSGEGCCFWLQMVMFSLHPTWQVRGERRGKRDPERKRKREHIRYLLTRAIILLRGSTLRASSKPEYFPQSVPASAITLRVRAMGRYFRNTHTFSL